MCITESIYPEVWVLTKYLIQSYEVQCSVFNTDRVSMTTTTTFWFSVFDIESVQAQEQTERKKNETRWLIEIITSVHVLEHITNQTTSNGEKEKQKK